MRRNLRAAVLAPLAALTSFGLVATLTTVTARADTTTISNNTLRDGWYSTESALTPQAVAPGGRFRQLFSATVGGQVYGQPLVSKNTLLVTTENNNIYGLDSQTGPSNGRATWGRPGSRPTTRKPSTARISPPTSGSPPPRSSTPPRASCT